MHNSTIQYSYREWTAKIHPSVESERIKRKWNTENDDNRNFYSVFFSFILFCIRYVCIYYVNLAAFIVDAAGFAAPSSEMSFSSCTIGYDAWI